MYSSAHSDRHLGHVLALVVLFAIAAVGCDDQTGPVDDVLEVDQSSDADAAGDLDATDTLVDADAAPDDSDVAEDADVDPCEGITNAVHTEDCPYDESVGCLTREDVLCDELYPELGRGNEYCHCQPSGSSFIWSCQIYC